jgi:hypothetical protein
MVEKRLYECEICHTNYSDKESARKCEKGHQKIEGADITGCYKPVSMFPQGIPYKICVKFGSGVTAVYKL